MMGRKTLNKKTLDKKILDKKALDSKILDKKALDNKTLDNKAMDKKRIWTEAEYAASYTVEIAYIMAVFCLVMVVLVRQAYCLHDETKGGMTLQEAVELMRHDEDDRGGEITEEVRSRSGLLFSMDNLNLELGSNKSKITGRLSGSRSEGTWGLEISSKVYEPEEFLRKVAALKQLEERYEGQIQEGDAP